MTQAADRNAAQKPVNTADGAAVLEVREGPDADYLKFSGTWVIASIQAVDKTLYDLARGGSKPLIVDPGGIDRLDTAGAWMIARMKRDGERARRPVTILDGPAEYRALLSQVLGTLRPPPPVPRPTPAFIAMLVSLGQGTIAMADRIGRLLSFFGLILVTIGDLIIHPRRLRVISVVHHMKAVGVDAVPIVALMSFLIGIVLAYQGAGQLQRFGAEVFTVNLIALSVLREIGILMTAILVAGRSGSAFTAAIGSMKLREEVDALRSLGLDPVEILVVPRTLALLLTLPMLAVAAAFMGLLGGMVMCWMTLNISPVSFIVRLNEAVRINHFIVGVSKAPFFALAIATIGCFQGFEVEGSAESVGRLTTVSVVESIFVVIVLDAMFSIFFAAINY